MTKKSDFHRPPAWVEDAIFYQIFPDRFASSRRVRKPGHLEPWDSPPSRHGFKGGDLLGIAENLDHIEELGADAIYLNPVFSSASNHRYHAYDYHQVDPLLGGNEALRELIDAAHSRGMRIVLDGVFNHCGRGFWPFHHLLEEGAASPYADWFTVKRWPLNAYNEKQKPNYAAWWNRHALPKLNVANPDTRAYLLDVAERWIRFGADGWRLDVPTEIEDADFWRELRERVRGANPKAYLVGEIWREAPEWLEGDRFDALMNYPFARTALGFCAEKIARGAAPGGFKPRRLDAAQALEELSHQTGCYRREFVHAQLNLLGSHDTPRFLTLAGGDPSAFHLATILQMTLPGAPSIYYGDEVGMEGRGDPDCRRAFPWRRSLWHKPTWNFFRKAVALRRSHPVLRRGDFRPVHGSGGVLAFLRSDADESLLVVLNARREKGVAILELPRVARLGGEALELWQPQAAPAEVRREKAGAWRISVEIEPRSARVLAV